MVRTRIAPSPTGEDIHIGNLYTAYLNYIFAKKNKGKFIVRIEDTDQKRKVDGSEEQILKSLSNYNIISDEDVLHGGDYGPYRQSERLDIYKKYAQELVESHNAYYCTCSKQRLDEVRKKMQAEKKIPKYDKHCLNRQEEVKKEIEGGADYVIRLNVEENQEVVFHDIIRGEVKINTNNIDDQVLMKSDGFPTYHLAVVVDDYLMKITHVMRAEEWIASTPKHVLIYKALGFEIPKFAHLPILRNPDKSKLSKRKNPVWSSWYLEEGYLPEAVLNYLSLMGWSHPQEKEIFSREEFMKVFTLERIQPVGPVFDIKKLTWMNGQYIMKMSDQELFEKLKEFFKDKNYDLDILKKSVPLVKERIKTLKEYEEIAGFYYKAPENYEKNISSEKEIIKKITDQVAEISSWKADEIGESMQDLAKAEAISFSKFFMILRVALSGKKITPPLNESMEILGKEECIARLRKLG